MTEEEYEALVDLGILVKQGPEAFGIVDFSDELLIQEPPEEPEPPNMDSPPGEWTEYSDTPPNYRLLRLRRANYTAEEAAARSDALAQSWGVRKYGEGYWDARWWVWRCI